MSRHRGLVLFLCRLMSSYIRGWCSSYVLCWLLYFLTSELKLQSKHDSRSHFAALRARSCSARALAMAMDPWFSWQGYSAEEWEEWQAWREWWRSSWEAAPSRWTAEDWRSDQEEQRPAPAGRGPAPAGGGGLVAERVGGRTFDYPRPAPADGGGVATITDSSNPEETDEVDSAFNGGTSEETTDGHICYPYVAPENAATPPPHTVDASAPADDASAPADGASAPADPRASGSAGPQATPAADREWWRGLDMDEADVAQHDADTEQLFAEAESRVDEEFAKFHGHVPRHGDCVYFPDGSYQLIRDPTRPRVTGQNPPKKGIESLPKDPPPGCPHWKNNPPRRPPPGGPPPIKAVPDNIAPKQAPPIKAVPDSIAPAGSQVLPKNAPPVPQRKAAPAAFHNNPGLEESKAKLPPPALSSSEVAMCVRAEEERRAKQRSPIVRGPEKVTLQVNPSRGAFASVKLFDFDFFQMYRNSVVEGHWVDHNNALKYYREAVIKLVFPKEGAAPAANAGSYPLGVDATSIPRVVHPNKGMKNSIEAAKFDFDKTDTFSWSWLGMIAHLRDEDIWRLCEGTAYDTPHRDCKKKGLVRCMVVVVPGVLDGNLVRLEKAAAAKEKRKEYLDDKLQADFHVVRADGTVFSLHPGWSRPPFQAKVVRCTTMPARQDGSNQTFDWDEVTKLRFDHGAVLSAMKNRHQQESKNNMSTSAPADRSAPAGSSSGPAPAGSSSSSSGPAPAAPPTD